jgi:CheY-like chemotaxis protein
VALCRLLLIEDDPREAQALEEACCPDPESAAIDVVTNGSEAETVVREREYDLIICDLALPPDGRRMAPEVGEGRRLFELIREHAHGTPVIILSAHAEIEMMPGFFTATASGDLYGTQTEQSLVQFFPKERLSACVESVKSHIARTAVLDGLELDTPLDLELSDERALKIYGRRIGAASGRLEPLDGGLSDAKTFKVSYADNTGNSVGHVVAKLGTLRDVVVENSKYEQLAAMLPVGLGALVLWVVQVGAGQRGALIYQLADQHTRSLFGLVAEQEAEAAVVVQRLEGRLGEWTDDAPVVVKSLTDLRRHLITDLDLQDAIGAMFKERGIEVSVREAMAHGDLHGLNALVDERNEPTLIDYGEVRRAHAALDPVTLELSILFHPAMIGKLGDWPTEEQAANWIDLDQFCVGCPVEDYVRACRAWATRVAVDEDELLAAAYCYAVRQVKYADAPTAVAIAVARGAFERLSG